MNTNTNANTNINKGKQIGTDKNIIIDNILYHPSHKPLHPSVQNLVKNALSNEITIDKSCIIKELSTRNNNSLSMNTLLPVIIKCSAISFHNTDESYPHEISGNTGLTGSTKTKESFGLTENGPFNNNPLANIIIFVLLVLILYYLYNNSQK
jgi:hypothetical protein